ncbi:ribosome hibernation-promoting factor, HPF/YfiA family [Marinactinospora thermotolerans]|uniref:Ribosome hibernation promoting factor n=1 Tax=Marinactinospora thermotolerans DSM 45154 TaxID=1122192 RepID=A0A1T4QJ85_9ACTN|nr:ribosome-associated translation inhibitor RaiA [Marinactinospora thermotolerans]SKA03843.1 SSU ribosomal protein S30P/sigma 54 modulation protein [Marinactinospora thermotolerans DSM 45154]
MDIIVKGRRTGVSDKFRQHVENKLNRLSKWEHKGMSVDVEVSKERNPKLADQRERVELTIHSSGPVVRGEAAADDRYSALDLALDRIESRLRKAADRRKVHKGGRTPVSVAAATASLGDAQAAPLGAVATPPAPTAPMDDEEIDGAAVDEAFADEVVELDTQGDAPVIVREKFHYAKPMTIDQALMEMELVGHDFYLFRDEERDAPSVVYRRKGFNYGVLRLME